MSLDIFREYQKAIKVLKSEEYLNQIQVSTYPHIKNKEDRDKIRKSYTQHSGTKAVTGIEMARKLAGWQTKK